MLWTYLSWFFPTKQKGGAMYLRDRILYDFHGRCFGVRPKSRLRDIICCARTSRTCISTFALSAMFFCSFFFKKMPPFNSYISCNPPPLLFRLQVWWGFLQRVDCCNCRSKRKLAVNHHVRTKKKMCKKQCIGSMYWVLLINFAISLISIPVRFPSLSSECGLACSIDLRNDSFTCCCRLALVLSS